MLVLQVLVRALLTGLGIIHACTSVCICILNTCLARNRNQQQAGKGGEIPWAFKSPGLSFPEAHTEFAQTGSLRLCPFHGSAGLEAPTALQVKCFPSLQ